MLIVQVLFISVSLQENWGNKKKAESGQGTGRNGGGPYWKLRCATDCSAREEQEN